jgi:hypothetical protein
MSLSLSRQDSLGANGGGKRRDLFRSIQKKIRKQERYYDDEEFSDSASSSSDDDDDDEEGGRRETEEEAVQRLLSSKSFELSVPEEEDEDSDFVLIHVSEKPDQRNGKLTHRRLNMFFRLLDLSCRRLTYKYKTPLEVGMGGSMDVYDAVYADSMVGQSVRNVSAFNASSVPQQSLVVDAANTLSGGHTCVYPVSVAEFNGRHGHVTGALALHRRGSNVTARYVVAGTLQSEEDTDVILYYLKSMLNETDILFDHKEYATVKDLFSTVLVANTSDLTDLEFENGYVTSLV